MPEIRIGLKHFARLLPVLLCFSSLAQVNVTIKDPTNSGFILGVNGFMQNTKPVDQISIKGLDTIPHQLTVQLDSSVWFSKLIHLRSAGNYHYIITTNSRDELQLRYRGKTSSLPQGIISMDVQRLVPMPQPEPIITASVKSDEDLDVASADTIENKEVVPTRDIVEVKTLAPEIEILLPDTTTLETSIVIKDTLPILDESLSERPNPFTAFIADLQQTEFEFEKLQKSSDYALNHTLSLEELRQIFKLLSYDNSRLQLLQSLKKENVNILLYKSLANDLDYEISREKFNEIIKE